MHKKKLLLKEDSIAYNLILFYIRLFSRLESPLNYT